MVRTIARWVVYAGIFAVPFIPFLVTDSMFFPFITGKNFAFRIIVELILAAWLILALVDTSYRPKRSWIFIAASLFALIIALADITGINPTRSFWSNFERMEGLIGLLHTLAYLIVLGTVLATDRMWKAFWNTSIAVSVAMTLYAFSQLAGALTIHQGGFRVDATFGNATYFAVYLLLHIFITLVFLYRSHKNKALIAAYLMAIVFQTISLYYTGTRGALLGLVGGLVLASLILVLKGKEHPRIRRFAGIGLGAIVLFGALFLAMRNTSLVQGSPLLSRIANASLQDTTIQSRYILWTRIGWNGFKERPLLGWGQDNFIVVFGKYYDPLMYKQEPWFDRAHNVFMDWLVAGGILGLLSYLFLFGAGIYLLWKTKWSLPEKALVTGLFAAYFTHNIFVFDNLVSYIFFASVLAWIHSAVVNAESMPQIDSRAETAPVSPALAQGGAALLIVLAFGAIWFLNIRDIGRSRTLIKALTAEYRKDYPNVLALYEEALAYGPGTGREETREQFSQSLTRVVNTDTDDAVKNTFAQRAIMELVASTQEDPGNTRPLFFLGHTLNQIGQKGGALKAFEEALAINPNRQNFLYEEADIYRSQKQFDDMIATLKRAYEAEKENDRAFGYYAAAVMFAGRYPEGEALLLEHFGTTTVDNDLVLDAYRDMNRFDKIIEIFNARLKAMAPADDAETRFALAMAYLELEKRAEAIAELEKAAELEPTFVAQATQMIEAIKAGKKIIIN